MLKMNVRYWICQLLGWGGWTLINIFFVNLFAHDVYLKPAEKMRVFYAAIFIEFCWSILATHFLRFGLKKMQWMRLPVKKVIMLFIAGVCITGLLSYYGARGTAILTKSSIVEYEKNENLQKAIQKEKLLNVADINNHSTNKVAGSQSPDILGAENIKKSTGWFRDKSGNWQYEDQRKGRFWWDLIFTFLMIALWLLLYMIWHYLEKFRNDQVDRLTLEKTVKELEVKTIKSHINPHFIFNSLNSIRALVDENPERARKAITELSNILRSSLQVEKLETVPLEKELDIVKDYLALEYMRFEERLKIEMDIDEDTLQQPVPPMMLQTLVENAIKHGVSKNIKGGTVKVISQFNNEDHELIVLNSGHLNGERNENGFGIKSTEDRLRFLYFGKAHFEIINLADNMVQSKVTIPII